jgi:hypothetical protein
MGRQWFRDPLRRFVRWVKGDVPISLHRGARRTLQVILSQLFTIGTQVARLRVVTLDNGQHRKMSDATV